MSVTQDRADQLDHAGSASSPDDQRVLGALRAGDEDAFSALITAHHPAMLRVARLYVADDAVAQEVVQEAWLGVLQGLDRFEGRASLKTWIFRILVNRAKTRAVREGRTIPFSALDRDDAGSAEPTIDADRFDPVRHHWTTPPASWGDVPEERLLAQETRACLDAAIAAMPANQRAVISLRDLSGLTADEVCQILGVSEANQRVLLHRARARARRALEQYFDGDGSGR